MSFRVKLALAFIPVALLPVVMLAVIVRQVMNDRFATQFDDRVDAEIEKLERDVDRFARDLGARIGAIGIVAADDNRFRLAAVGAGDRSYLLDYAERAMQLSGLDVLRIQDADGRVLSSGHFRNGFDQRLPLVSGLAPPANGAVTMIETPRGPLAAMVRSDSFRLGDQQFHILGGISVDRFFDLGRPSADVEISLRIGDLVLWGPSAFAESITKEIAVPYIGRQTLELRGATILIAHSLASLRTLQERLDRWFWTVFGLTAMLALGVAVFLAARLSKPLSALATSTKRVDLDHLDVHFHTDRNDEIGVLTRLLDSMVSRIRTSTSRLREVERRAAVGDLARQVNHDIKNGLVPIRNVFEHLSQVQREDPAKLVDVFEDRRGTVTSSIAYLENLASQYAKLSPASNTSTCDLTEVLRAAENGVELPAGCELRIDVEEGLPLVRGDRLAVRRIVENLMGNAIDSLGNASGVVTLASSRSSKTACGVHLSVSDTGRGMREDELERAFEDFHTTKETGTGLGLSVVRRLIADLGGSIKIQTEPGAGTTVLLDFPGHERKQTA